MWVYLIFAILFGACIGSFLNVVIYRLPAEKSLWWPPSHCPRCGRRLAISDNVPVVAWLWLRGRCRYCGISISVQYPLIEAFSAALFALLFAVYYLSPLREDFSLLGPGGTWPVLALHCILVAGLLAASVIDARLFIIPQPIPWFISAVAMLGLPLAAALMRLTDRLWEPFRSATRSVWPVVPESFTLAGLSWQGPAVHGAFIGAAIGGAAGLAVGLLLMGLGLIPRSFDEEPGPDSMPSAPLAEGGAAPPELLLSSGPIETPTAAPPVPAAAEAGPPQIAPADGLSDAADVRIADARPDPQIQTDGFDRAALESWIAHPRIGQEILKETLFLLFPIVGLIAGAWIGAQVTGGAAGAQPMQPIFALRVLAGSMLGFLIGGGLIWVTRVVFTLAFRKEAMGLGDVHLLAAIGAVLGPLDAVLTFFIAPFFGLAYALIAFGVGRILKGQVRVIPFGPYLALGALVMMIFRQPIYQYLQRSGIL